MRLLKIVWGINMKLFYDDRNKKIYLETETLKRTVLEEDFPSKPVFSPDKKTAVYIAPLEWETIGNVYSYDFTKNEKKTLIQFTDESSSPKDIIWLDNENLAMIIGFAHGTIAVGGAVFKYNLKEEKLERLTEDNPRIQFMRLTKKKNKLIADGIEYIDDQYLHSKNCSIEITNFK